MKRKPLPVWLRRLDLVKAELKGWRFPRNAEEGLLLCAKLSAAYIRSVKKMLRKKHPGADERKIMFEMRRLFDRRKKAEMRLAQKWKKERDKFFVVRLTGITFVIVNYQWGAPHNLP